MLKRIATTHRAAVAYCLLVVCVPVLTLVILGLVQLWQSHWLLPVTIGWLLATVLGYAVYWHFSTPKKNDSKDSTQHSIDHSPDSDSADTLEAVQDLPLNLKQRADWSSQDQLVWQRALVDIEHVLAANPDWDSMPDVLLELLSTVSHYYKQDTIPEAGSTSLSAQPLSYRFTAPEILLVVAETATRYRQLLLAHVPFADKIMVSTIMSLYSRKAQIRRGAGWLNNARRAARFVNPLTAVVAELRDQFTGQLFTNLSKKLQHDLKRLLLQELVQVAMDLYSGRLKASTDELASYQSAALSEDLDNMAQAAEPLRVVIVGQVSAGKSSLVNALTNELNAETDILPSTDRTTVHQLSWKDDDSDSLPLIVHLVDTVGLSSQSESIEALLSISSEADIIVWCAKATQSARAPDAQLFKQLQLLFDAQPARRAPPCLLVLTHVDQLSPKGSWEPPYDLNSDNAKAMNMARALQSCTKQIGLPTDTLAIPVCLNIERSHYNIDTLSAELMSLRDMATQVQFNRRRHEHNTNTPSWQTRWQQAQALGRETGKVLVRSILD